MNSNSVESLIREKLSAALDIHKKRIAQGLLEAESLQDVAVRHGYAQDPAHDFQYEHPKGHSLLIYDGSATHMTSGGHHQNFATPKKLNKYLDDFQAVKEDEITEVSPPGFSGTVAAMKKHKEISNPWALAWYMKNKGAKAHYKPEKTDESEETHHLWGLHRITGGWKKLQTSDKETLKQYQPYFAKTTLADEYTRVPFSGFSKDIRPVYTQFHIGPKPPRDKK